MAVRTMDDLDIRILGRLLNNCREPASQVAIGTGKTSITINSKIQRMLAGGVIEKFAVRVEPSVFGYGVLYIAVSGEDADDVLSQIRQVGEPYFAVPCIGGITVCGIIVKEDMQSKIRMASRLMKDVQVLFVFESEGSGCESDLTKTDLRILGELARNPRQRIETVANRTGYSTKTVARCIARLQRDNGVQFTLVYDPRRFDKFIPHVIMVQTDGDVDRTLRNINERFSDSYLQVPFVAKNQIVLFMYSDGIFRMDELTHAVRTARNVKSANLFIPKKILLFNKWLEDTIREAEKLPGLHVDARRLRD